MRLRLVQKNITVQGFGGHLDAARNSGLDIICFNELSATGCLYTPRDVPPREYWLEQIGDSSLTVMFGAAIREDNLLFNTYFCAHGDHVQEYRKINLFPPFNEPHVYEPGTAPGLFETRFGQFGVAVCYDLRFDDIFARMAQLELPYIIAPSAFPRERIDDYRNLLRQRAGETGATVIGVNAVGDDGENEFGGSSMVVTPGGDILAQADETGETVLDIEL